MVSITYVCKTCEKEFVSNRKSVNRTPTFCSRKCAGYKKGFTPHNKGKGKYQLFDSCTECGKQKKGYNARVSPRCHTCENKKRAKSTVYTECPRCGKPKNGRGRSDRVLCNSCAAFDRWKVHFNEFGINCQNKDYFGFTEKLKELIRDRHGRMCAFCGSLEDKRKHHVHHIDYDKKNSRPNNLLCLCNTCHPKTNFNREFWKEECLKVMKKNNWI